MTLLNINDYEVLNIFCIIYYIIFILLFVETLDKDQKASGRNVMLNLINIIYQNMSKFIKFISIV